ncbi:hypothetical protein SMICM304S_00123 [Streptomyces microflavus]
MSWATSPATNSAPSGHCSTHHRRCVDRVLDERDDVGLGDIARDEIGHDQCAGGVQCLLQGVQLHTPIVRPARGSPTARARSTHRTTGGVERPRVENIFQM